jgi:WD40 repeat protein
MSPSRLVLLSSCFLFFGVASSASLSAGEPERPRRDVDPEVRQLPVGAVARLGSLRLRHEQEVQSIVFSPDGKMIASAAKYDGKIRVWETVTGKLLHEVEATGLFSRASFAPDDYTLAVTPDGKSIAAGVGPDVCFWDLQSGREIRRFHGPGKGILKLTFSADGMSFYSGGADNKLYHWDIASGELVQCWDYFEGNRPRIYASGFPDRTAELKAVTPDGKTAVWFVRHWADHGTAVGVDATQLTVWDAATGKDRCRLTDREDKDFFDANVILSADGKYVTPYSENSELTLWDAATGRKLKDVGSGAYIEAAAYSADCRRVAAITRGNRYTLSVWDLTSGEELSRHDVAHWHAFSKPSSLAFSPDGRFLALTDAKNVRIWDSDSDREIPALDGHRRTVGTLEFSPHSGALTSSDDETACEWDATHRQTTRRSLNAGGMNSRSVAESHESKLCISQPDSRGPQLRELISGKLLHEFQDLKPIWYYGSFSADGRTVVLVSGDRVKKIDFLDVPSRTVRSSVTTDALITSYPTLSRDGAMLAAACSDQTVLLIDSLSGEIVVQIGTPRPPPGENEPRLRITKAAFSSDGRYLAFGTRVERPEDRFNLGDFATADTPEAHVWDLSTGREMRQFENCLKDAPNGGIASLEFSPDSKSLAIGLNYNPWHPGSLEEAAVPVLEVASGRPRRRLKGHTDQVASVAFSPDGKTLATGSRDSTILLWDMRRNFGTEPTPGTAVSERMRALWNRLAEREAAHAYDAVLSLADMRDQCVPFLSERLKPVECPSNARMAKLIADLDDESFAVREEASARLVALHEVARPALNRALMGKVSLETRRRIRELLSQLDDMAYTPSLLRELRSVEVLERMASDEARRVLETLAAGAPGAIVTVEAKASLARMKAVR